MKTLKKSFPVLLLLLSIIVSIVSGAAVICFGRTAEAAQISEALTNVSTVGGIVSGLSLAATSILTISGSYRLHVLKNYGHIVRLLLFGGFSLVVTLAMISAVAVAWEGESWLIWLLGIAFGLTLLTMFSTALLYSAAFGWQEYDDAEQRPKGAPKFNF